MTATEDKATLTLAAKRSLENGDGLGFLSDRLEQKFHALFTDNEVEPMLEREHFCMALLFMAAMDEHGNA